MAYTLTSAIKNRYLQRVPQICNLVVEFLSGTSQPGNKTGIILTESDIVSGGLNIDRQLFSGDSFEIGTAICAESTIILNNKDGRFDGYHFEGATITVKLGLAKNGSNDGRTTTNESLYRDLNGNYVKTISNAVPMGTFYVDNCPRSSKQITLTCLDAFAKFDKVIPETNTGISSTDNTVAKMIIAVCTHIGIDVYRGSYSTALTYLNTTFSYSATLSVALPTYDGRLTYRALLQYLLQLMGSYAFMDWDNKVHIFKKNGTSVETITSANRYSSNVQENTITLTGVTVSYKQTVDGAETDAVLSAGTSTYAVAVEGNPLVTESNAVVSSTSVATKIWNEIRNYPSYVPFEITARPYMWLYPGDTITIANNQSTNVSTFITNTNFTMNGSVRLESHGVTGYEKGWASSDAFTAQQTAIIRSIAKPDNSALIQKYNDVLNLNKMLARSMGLWMTQINGVYYFYSVKANTYATTAPSITTIDLSYGTHSGVDIVYTFGSNGIGWSTSFNSTINTATKRNNLTTAQAIVNALTWSYGITSEGNAVLNRIRAYTISADDIVTGTLNSTNGEAYFNLDNGEIGVGGGNFRTVIQNGIIRQFYSVTSLETGGVTPVGESGSGNEWQAIYASSRSNSKGVSIGYAVGSNGYNAVAEFNKTDIKFKYGIKTNTIDYNDQFAGITHFRTNKFGNTSTSATAYTMGVKFGCGSAEKRPTIGLELRDASVISTSSNSDITARLDIYAWESEDAIRLRGICGGVISKPLELGNHIYYNGEINAVAFNPSSTPDIKENIRDIDTALDVLKGSTVHQYNLIEDAESVEDDGQFHEDSAGDIEQVKQRVGFVIGDNTPELLLSKDKKHIDLYTVVSLNWKATQEIIERLETLEGRLS